MKPKFLFAVILVSIGVLSLVLFAQNNRKNRSQAVATATKTSDQARSSKIVAYYFHGNVRCMTCRKIESLSHDVVATNFADQLNAGQLQWQTVNVELPENEHFFKDYQLVTWSLVLVKYENGKQTGYKVLSDTWKLVNNEQAFRGYVKSEVQASLGRS